MIIINGSIKPINDDCFNEITALMAQCMREEDEYVPDDYSITTEYPNVFSKTNRQNLWALYENGEAVSACATYSFNITLAGQPLKLLGVGSVSTAPKHRRKGYAATLLNFILQYYTNEDPHHLSILWTHLFNYYRKFNYELVGSEITYVFENTLELSDSKYECSLFKETQLNDIFNLYQQNNCQIQRSKEEFEKYLKIPNMEILIASYNSIPVAYTIRGKGSDLKATIHEWAGDSKALICLINENIAREPGDRLFLITPPNTTLDKELQKRGASRHEGKLGMINILNPTAFSPIFEQYSSSIKVLNENKISVMTDTKEITMDIKEFTQLVFGPPSPILLNLKSLTQVFPLNFFVWGLDSV